MLDDTMIMSGGLRDTITGHGRTIRVPNVGVGGNVNSDDDACQKKVMPNEILGW